MEAIDMGLPPFFPARRKRWAAAVRFAAVPLRRIVLLTACLALVGCGGKDSPPPPDSGGPDSFTFFEVGAQTVLTDSVRDRLRAQLGRPGVSHRNVLDLAIQSPEFFSEHFPGLSGLHRKLNGTSGARVEHDTVRLDFRYMDRNATPFDRVQMTFDEETGKPLLVRIETRRDGEAVAAALAEAYGPPRVIDAGPGIQQSRVWTREGDVLVFSLDEAAAGIPEYRIAIFYVNGLRRLVEREAARREARQARERDAINRAF
jgi:hypothetical protein